jgi:hypothetical protein
MPVTQIGAKIGLGEKSSFRGRANRKLPFLAASARSVSAKNQRNFDETCRPKIGDSSFSGPGLQRDNRSLALSSNQSMPLSSSQSIPPSSSQLIPLSCRANRFHCRRANRCHYLRTQKPKGPSCSRKFIVAREFAKRYDFNTLRAHRLRG